MSWVVVVAIVAPGCILLMSCDVVDAPVVVDEVGALVDPGSVVPEVFPDEQPTTAEVSAKEASVARQARRMVMCCVTPGVKALADQDVGSRLRCLTYYSL